VPPGTEDGLLLAGEIGKPHGVSGEVYVMVISDDPRRFDAGARLQHDDGRVLTVESARRHGDRFLVKFEELTDRASAQAARGALYVPATEARDLDEDEFWHRDLAGCLVVTVSGDEVGTIAEVVSGPAQDLLVVTTSSGERLVPAVREIVVGVDIGARRVTIDPPEGLL